MSLGRSRLLLAGAVAAIVVPLLMWAEFLGVGLWTPGYNVFTRAASDLGAVGAPTAGQFRMGFFVLPGVMAVVVAAALLALPFRSFWWRLGGGVVALNGVLLVLAGLNPENPLSPSDTARHQMLATFCFGAAAVASAALLAGLPGAASSRLAPRAWLLGTPALLSLQFGGLVARSFVTFPDGLFQRPFGIALTVWYAGTAWLLMRAPTGSARAS